MTTTDAQMGGPPDLAIEEGPGTEMARVMNEGDPDAQILMMERKAELAPRFLKAMQTILMSQTFPQDWETFGTGDKAKVCLSSAGAERVARLFDIQFFEVVSKREDFTDALGQGYRYVFEGKAALGSRVVFSQGTYSTRDKFLGFADGGYRPLEDINEGNIRNAAYHIFCGNAIKGLLGLRGIPLAQFHTLMGQAGGDPVKAGGHAYGSGTQGGSSQTEHEKQSELAERCIALANAGLAVVRGDDSKWITTPMSDGDDRPELERAAVICVALSSFPGRDGKEVSGLPASRLKGQRLAITLATARALAKEVAGAD